MSRILRQFLVASLVTLHTAVLLCGPCLHALPGSGHDASTGPPAKPHRTSTPEKVPHDTADRCPICHFLTQGQLPVESSRGLSAQRSGEPVPIALSAVCPALSHHPSRPRAPPLAATNLT